MKFETKDIPVFVTFLLFWGIPFKGYCLKALEQIRYFLKLQLDFSTNDSL